MPKLINLTGMTFGRLIVLGRVPVLATRNGFKNAMWDCRCECGNSTQVAGANLRSGETGSCGCFHKERVIAAKTKHGLGNSPAHRSWSGMLQRCHNQNSNGYYNYGAKGITVCERWRMSFADFHADMGPRPKGHTLDRIDNTKGYSPENCRWASVRDQSRNTSRTFLISYNENTHCLSDWAKLAGVSRTTIYSLIRSGEASPEEAVAQCMENRRKVKKYTSKISIEAAKLGVTKNAIYNLMKQGKTVEAAVAEISARQKRSAELRATIGNG